MSLVDAIFKAAVIVALCIGSASISYYYLIYLPQRDAILDARRQLDLKQIEDAKAREERARVAKERQLEKDKFEISNRYDLCKLGAATNYSDEWDSNCARLSTAGKKSRADCLKMGTAQNVCESIHPTRPEKECSLPKDIAESLERRLEAARQRCFQEFQAGAH